MITLPNLLTLIRILGIIIFIVLFFFEKIIVAAIILCISAITDILDGLTARLLKQESELGSFLDPLADKLLVVTTTIILATRNYIPGWFFVIIFLRDILIVIGWFIMKSQSFNSLKTEPRFLGKTAVFFQMITLSIVIISLVVNIEVVSLLKPIFYIITSVLTIISLVDYVYSFRGVFKQVNK